MTGDVPQDAVSKYLRPIRRGEYDIATVSIVGYDPADGRSYEDCHAEWRRELERVEKARMTVSRWNLKTRLRLRLQTSALATHLGMK